MSWEMMIRHDAIEALSALCQEAEGVYRSTRSGLRLVEVFEAAVGS